MCTKSTTYLPSAPDQSPSISEPADASHPLGPTPDVSLSSSTACSSQTVNKQWLAAWGSDPCTKHWTTHHNVNWCVNANYIFQPSSQSSVHMHTGFTLFVWWGVLLSTSIIVQPINVDTEKGYLYNSHTNTYGPRYTTWPRKLGHLDHEATFDWSRWLWAVLEFHRQYHWYSCCNTVV